MTVGIAAISQSEDNPHIVLGADRMVTDRGGLEYEGPESKIETLVHQSECVAVAVGAGRNDWLAEIIETAHELIAQNAGRDINVDDVNTLFKTAYQHVIQGAVEDELLAPLGYQLSDLRDEDQHIPNQIQSEIVSQSQEFRKAFEERAQFIVAGVDAHGAQIFEHSGGGVSKQTHRGYSVVGSGAESAHLTFVRGDYEKSTSLEDALFTVAEAKTQSEERQGVGAQMDLVKISEGRYVTVEDTAELRNQLTKITDKEREARENVISQW